MATIIQYTTSPANGSRPASLLEVVNSYNHTFLPARFGFAVALLGKAEELPKEVRGLEWVKANLSIDGLTVMAYGTAAAPQVHTSLIKSDSPDSNWIYVVRDHKTGTYVSAIIPPESQDQTLPFGSSIHSHPECWENYEVAHGTAYVNQKLPEGWLTKQLSVDGEKTLAVPPSTLHTAVGWKQPAILAIQMAQGSGMNGSHEGHSHVYDGRPHEVFNNGWYYPEPGVLRQGDLVKPGRFIQARR